MKGTAIALASCMFLGLETAFAKVLLRHMSPLAIAAFSTLFAAIVLVFILELEHKVWELWRLNRRELAVLFVVSLVSGMAAQVLYVTGLRESTASNAVLLTRLNSLLIALFGIVFLRERLRVNHVVGAVLMLGGILVIATRQFSVEIQPQSGDLLLLLAAVCWASANILMKKYLSHVPPEIIVVGYNGFAGLVLLTLVADELPGTLTAEAITYLAGMILLVSVIGRYLWYWAFEHTSACNVGLASLTIPLFGILYSIILLGEALSPYQLFGGALILGGLVVVEYQQICHVDTEHRLKRHHPHH